MVVGGLVLAAGAGRRMGAPKALLRLRGTTLADRTLRIARDGGCDPAVVVLGAQADRVRAAADLTGATVLVNADWESGLGSSLRAGLAALAGTRAVAALVLLVDTPGVSAAAVRRVLARGDRRALVCATYDGQRRHPILLGRDHWTAVAALAEGDVGARPYLSSAGVAVAEVPCDDVADPTDLDTVEDAWRCGVDLGGATP
ncbi:nucleotidyltransferase family protein [Micromonospora echinofusca]|uniref:NTP transferase domain-containing protein n=1 Tax=Micromonospora echinofusca TaxID=47858 RepID=A0ABS3VIT6_MICEH|nr:nucleotidyltransferase family protein [Micromonospora echinofusca]MBO4204445.1 NTP transferase domain-containing protein [Micromonospora echinofusca]